MRPLVRLVGVAVAGLSLTCCLFGCSSQSPNVAASSDQPAKQEQETQSEQEVEQKGETQPIPLYSIRAFHCQTGMSEPSEYMGTPAELEQAKARLVENEANSDDKIIFVAAEVVADDQEDIKVGAVNDSMIGATTSAGELTIDGENSYSDIHGLNSKDCFDVLELLEFHDGADNDILKAGSGDSYCVIIIFSISSEDYEQGSEAHLQWGDFSVDFPMSDIVEVDTPKTMTEKLE